MEGVNESVWAECSPWDRNSAIVNQVLMGIPVAIGAQAIARYRPLKLIYYLPGVVLLVTAWRRFVCARCQYYGKECSTLLGISTARMMPRDEEKALDRNTMMADFTYMGVLALIPLPQVLKKGAWRSCTCFRWPHSFRRYCSTRAGGAGTISAR